MIRIAKRNDGGSFEFVGTSEYKSSEQAKRGLKTGIAKGEIEEGDYILIDVKKQISAKAEKVVKIKEIGAKKKAKKVKKEEAV